MYATFIMQNMPKIGGLGAFLAQGEIQAIIIELCAAGTTLQCKAERKRKVSLRQAV